MNIKFLLCLVIAGVTTVIASGHTSKDARYARSDPPYSHKDSLNQPVLFAEGIVTTPDDEFGGTFMPDGKTIYFSKSVLRFYIDVICYSEFKNGKWQTPKVAPFSGRYRDFDPVISADGTKM